MTTIVHQLPEKPGERTPCCDKPLFALGPGEGLSREPEKVNCR